VFLVADIRRLLVANRGEIALRILRSCAELGIDGVAIYTLADRFSPHVAAASEAILLGEDPLQGYLDVGKVVAAAVASRCDAIHPGYGFLSENPHFAEACQREGILFVGPRAEVIRQMGDKSSARRAMQAAGVPITPGSEGNLASVAEALAIAEEIGYPVMLKATNGGGGRGIRRCNHRHELEQNYARVVSEAEKAFGRAEIFLEKLIDAPRHIEVQILADHHGNIRHIGDRDCSIQRRHQKLVEIAPAPQLEEGLRQQIHAAAINAARHVGYTNAGTVEFLVSGDGHAYFMEVNTRIQVEHPVSEMVTGLDLIAWQIRIAGGEAITWPQESLRVHGHAIEFRLNAEDPANAFAPCHGTLQRIQWPGGPGVRIDSGIEVGQTIAPYFDSMLAKLIVWGEDWPSALARARRALGETAIEGVATTLPFHRHLAASPEFAQGHFTTDLLNHFPTPADELPALRQRALAIAAALLLPPSEPAQ
jgi:pyruvate carboxylase subunit A